MSTPPETLFVGGGTGSGKTTLARALATRHGLRELRIDSFWYAHGERAGETPPPPDVQWLEWTPATQAADFERISRQMLGFVLEDLHALPGQPPVVVEGPQVVPDLLPPDACAVFLVPTADFQRRALSPRPMPSSDPAQALANRLVKDRLWADRVAALAAERGFPTIVVDGTRPPEDIRAEVEAAFGELLASAEPVDLASVRRWENDHLAGNLRRWVDSDDGRDHARVAFAFACECGARGCAELVRLTLDELAAARPVLAAAHR